MSVMTYQKIPTLYLTDKKTKLCTCEYSNNLFGYLSTLEWVFTEKIDGTNLRIVWDGFNISFLGRTNDAIFEDDVLIYLNETYNNNGFKKLLEEKVGTKLTILFGELFGQKIGCYGNYYDSNELRVRFFDVSIDEKYLNYTNSRNFIESIGEEYVPEVFRGTLNNCKSEVLASHISSVSKNFSNLIIEGLVGQPIFQLYNEKKERIIVKLRVEDLLKKTFAGQDLRILGKNKLKEN